MKRGNQDSRKVALSVLLVALLAFGVVQPAKSQPIADPLQSWNDGSAKKAISDFVARVTPEGGKDFVPVAERIATSTTTGRSGRSSPSTWGVLMMKYWNDGQALAGNELLLLGSWP